jgi:hypothetical protein
MKIVINSTSAEDESGCSFIITFLTISSTMWTKNPHLIVWQKNIGEIGISIDAGVLSYKIYFVW